MPDLSFTGRCVSRDEKFVSGRPSVTLQSETGVQLELIGRTGFVEYAADGELYTVTIRRVDGPGVPGRATK